MILYRLKAPKLIGIPQPSRIPFFGHTIEFVQKFDRMQDHYNLYSRRFKRTWGLSLIRLGFVTEGAVVLVTPNTVKHVLKTNFKNYVKGHQLNGVLGEFLGDGIFTSDGTRWRTHRKVATQMFSKKLLKQGTKVATRQAKCLCDKVADYAKKGQAFDLQRLFYNFTMDTFCSIAFGVDLDSQNRDNAFTRAFDDVQMISNRRPQSPFWKFRRAFRCHEERRLTEGVREMHAFAKRIIGAKRRTLERDGDLLGPDLISRFLVRAKRDGKEVTDKELIDLVLNFIIAGRDTTAAALSWTMYELIEQSSGRDIQEKVIAEIEANGGAIDTLSEEKLFEVLYGNLPYTKAVIMEGLRLHPSVPKDIKFAVDDDVLPDGTRVKAGMAVMYVPYAMGRDPSLWPDPLRFDPDRWINRRENDDESSSKASSLFGREVSEYTYPVFNAGPRICIGRPLAILEMQLMLSMLLSRFSFRPENGTLDGSYTQTIVPPLKHGLPVKARVR